MNISERITIDDKELFQYLESMLDKLQPFAYDNRYRTLLGNGIINKLSRWDKDIRKQKDIPLTVVVCGEFKRGKSSLINALLGEDIVTTNITTETITVNRISYGEHSNEIMLKGGKRIKLTDDELKCDNLKGILREIPDKDKITMLELKRPLEILKDITIIDTPGLGDSIKDFTEEVEYALRQADAVIYVFSVMYPISMQELFFMKTAIKPQKYTELFLAANYCDRLETESDIERLEDTIHNRMKDILPEEKPFMVSALDERCRQIKKAFPNEELAPVLSFNFKQMRSQIDELVSSKKNLVIPDRVKRMITMMMEDLETDIGAISDGLSLSMEELSEKREEIIRKKQQQANEQEEILGNIDKKADLYRGKAIDWISEFVDCMEKDIDNISDLPVEDIKKYYSLFCVDILQSAIDKCNEYFMGTLYDELENVSVEAAKKLSMSPVESEHNFQISLNSKTWTKGDNVEFANTFAQNALGISSLLVSFVAGSMREHEIKKNAPDIIKSIKEQYPQLKVSIVPAISDNYLKIGEKAKKQFVEYFDEKKTELENLLNQSEMAARQDEDKKLEIKEALNEISDVLRNIKTEFSNI